MALPITPKPNMQTKIFTKIFDDAIPLLSVDWKNKYGDLLSKEHWRVIRERVLLFVLENKINHYSLPVFREEIIPEYPRHYQYFESLKALFEKEEKERVQLVAKTIATTPIESLLVILGQRKTPATLTDENGIPPLKEPLLESCFVLHNEHKSKAARAREKHISRNNKNNFWGEIAGTPAEKEKISKAIVKKIMAEKTWWNVFTHYKHDVVYEIRVASGEGIRWKKNELELIGFLEAFDVS